MSKRIGESLSPPEVTRPANPASLFRVWNSQPCIALLVGVMIVLPRSMLVTKKHSETWDEYYHLSNGLALLTGSLDRMELNDPPVGAALIALPLWVAGCKPNLENVHY